MAYFWFMAFRFKCLPDVIIVQHVPGFESTLALKESLLKMPVGCNVIPNGISARIGLAPIVIRQVSQLRPCDKNISCNSVFKTFSKMELEELGIYGRWVNFPPPPLR